MFAHQPCQELSRANRNVLRVGWMISVSCLIKISAQRALPGVVRHPGGRPAEMCPSETMTLLACFHGSHYRRLKRFYLDYAENRFSHEFPSMVSYSRFVTRQAIVASCLSAYLLTCGTRSWLFEAFLRALKGCQLHDRKYRLSHLLP